MPPHIVPCRPKRQKRREKENVNRKPSKIDRHHHTAHSLAQNAQQRPANRTKHLRRKPDDRVKLSLRPRPEHKINRTQSVTQKPNAKDQNTPPVSPPEPTTVSPKSLNNSQLHPLSLMSFPRKHRPAIIRKFIHKKIPFRRNTNPKPKIPPQKIKRDS